jgi:hypothetical protein
MHFTLEMVLQKGILNSVKDYNLNTTLKAYFLIPIIGYKVFNSLYLLCIP